MAWKCCVCGKEIPQDAKHFAGGGERAHLECYGDPVKVELEFHGGIFNSIKATGPVILEFTDAGWDDPDHWILRADKDGYEFIE